jgi:hypothetical protein
MSKVKGTFLVSVEKRMYATGAIKVIAENADQAIEATQAMIDQGKLQTTEIEWSNPQYEDCSFTTTGDVDNV